MQNNNSLQFRTPSRLLRVLAEL